MAQVCETELYDPGKAREVRIEYRETAGEFETDFEIETFLYYDEIKELACWLTRTKEG